MRKLSLILCLLYCGLVVIAFSLPATALITRQESSCSTCHRRESGRAGEVVSIYETSTHHSAEMSCDNCHGGNPEETDKKKAHAGDFVARPDSNGILAMCGKCHLLPLELFKTSRHFPATRNTPRLDCAECHGVHAIGALNVSTDWSGVCVNCHGLEYLPELPVPLKDVLALSDQLRVLFSRRENQNLKLTPEQILQRKDIRHRISVIVHPTDLKDGLDIVPSILRDERSLIKQLQ